MYGSVKGHETVNVSLVCTYLPYRHTWLGHCYQRPYKPRHEASYLLMLYAAATTCVFHFHSVSTEVCTAKLAWEYFLKLYGYFGLFCSSGLFLYWIILLCVVLDYIAVDYFELYCCGLLQRAYQMEWRIILHMMADSHTDTIYNICSL